MPILHPRISATCYIVFSSAGELFTSFYFPWSSPCCPLIFFSSIDWEVVRLGVKDYPVIFVFHKTVLFLLISFIRTNRSHIFLLLLFVFFFIPSTKYVFLNNGLFSFFFFTYASGDSPFCFWHIQISFHCKSPHQNKKFLIIHFHLNLKVTSKAHLFNLKFKFLLKTGRGKICYERFFPSVFE